MTVLLGAMRKGVAALVLSAALAAPAIVSAASPATPTPSIEVTAPGPEGPLGGLAIDAGKATPEVLIIPGSGAVDRDGNAGPRLQSGSYRRLAEALAADGVSTVRVDKRGLYSSSAAVADPNHVTIGEYAADVAKWVAATRARTGAPCVWVLGHSEGGVVALTAADKDPAGICGLVLVATPGRPLGVVLREQLNANPANAPFLPEALRVLAQLEAGKPVAGDMSNPIVRQLFDPVIQQYWIDVLAQRPARMAAGYHGPLLMILGDRDLKVTADDLKALADAAPAATVVTMPGMTHDLKIATGPGREGAIATMFASDLPIAPGLADTIAGFIAKHPSPASGH